MLPFQQWYHGLQAFCVHVHVHATISAQPIAELLISRLPGGGIEVDTEPGRQGQVGELRTPATHNAILLCRLVAGHLSEL